MVRKVDHQYPWRAVYCALVPPQTATLRRRGRPRTGYLESLDGLRGIAVLPVLGYHFGVRAFGGGWLGVDLFFVISGYVVTKSLLRRMDADRWSPAEYFWRRFSRLAPVVIVAVTVVGVATALDPDRDVPLLGMATVATMTYNLALEVTDIDAHFFRHMWSLAIEWHFYIAAPLLVVALPRLARSRLVAILAALALASAMVRIAAVVVHPRPFFVYTLTPFRVDGLLLGCMIALAPTRWLSRIPSWISGASLVALVALLTLPPRWGDAILVSMGLLVVITNLTTSVLVAVEDQGRTPSFVTAVLRSRVLLWVGVRSYSLYVWHFIIGSGFLSPADETYQGVWTLVAQVGLSLVAADLSYRFIELPAQSWLNRHPPARVWRQRSKLAAAGSPVAQDRSP